VVKSGPYKDILAFDREMTETEQGILQELIDISYQQFVQTVAEARNLAVETVQGFADGRIFTGQQALALGVVDRLGTEEDARRWAAELAGLDPEKAPCFTLEEPKPLLSRLVSRENSALSQLRTIPGLAAGIDSLDFELNTAGQPLWLYRP
jgi:protease-4